MYSHEDAWQQAQTVLAESLRVRAAVGAPILVEGKLWGALMAATRSVDSWAENAETRIAAFTELVATAISNAESREALAELAGEQAALRRVATLVAQGAPPQDLFDAVAAEIGRLMLAANVSIGRYEPDESVTSMASWSAVGPVFPPGGRWPIKGTNVAWIVLQTGQPSRVDDFSTATDPIGVAVREAGYTSAVGSPIIVEGRLWGVISAASTSGPMPPGTEARLTSFTDLVGTAIANSQARGQVAALADEQAALRRVATLVAESAPASVVFAAVSEEVGRLLGGERTFLARFDADDITIVGAWPDGDGPTVLGLHGHLDAGGLAKPVRATNRPARVDRTDEGWAALPSVQELGLQSAVGAPITVQGRIWGMIEVASTSDKPVPPGTEERLADFTELVATAIANSQARAELSALADEQAALRRVATLVAEEAPPEAVFAAVSLEGARLFDAQCALERYDPGGIATVVGLTATGKAPPIGTQIPLGGHNAATLVFETGRPGRIDAFPSDASDPMTVLGRAVGHSALGAPINVAGRLWGVVALNSGRREPFPEGTEARLEGFADLVATAIANSQARSDASALADEQAALRRVATLVAEEAPPEAVFAAISTEAARLLDAACGLMRYDEDGNATIVGGTATTPAFAIGTTIPLGGQNTTTRVYETGRTARMDSFAADDSSPLTAMGRSVGRSAVGAPITVAGRLWGAAVVVTQRSEPLPHDTEARLEGFAELAATAIANAEARTELTASRARVIATADETRRRIERDLHDGAQQRLVTLGLQLRAAQASVPPGFDALSEELDGVVAGLTDALDELREYVRGIHPAVLVKGGLNPALRALARRSTVPVVLDLHVATRPPERIELSAYYIVSEALTNAAKHANASRVDIGVDETDDFLRLIVRDDGVGGARFVPGSGLVGLKDRVEALGGTLTLESPPGGGTALLVEVPMPAATFV